jgi:hypothetical protein
VRKTLLPLTLNHRVGGSSPSPPTNASEQNKAQVTLPFSS